MPYYLTCRDCSFQDVVTDHDAVLSSKERHQAERGTDHTVDFEAVEEEPLFRGGVSDDWE